MVVIDPICRGSTIVEDVPVELLAVGRAPLCRSIGYRRRPAKAAAAGAPGLVWLGGFGSDMRGTKATVLDRTAATSGRALLRLDYSGHGESGGRLEDGTIGLWLEEALAAVTSLTEGRQVIVGSSMGAWLALLVARALRQRGEVGRLAGLVLLAPAVDFTETLVWERMRPEARAELESTGLWRRPSAYGTEPYPITKALIVEGRNHRLLGSTIRTFCPVHIIQGMADDAVPWQHAMVLVELLTGDPVTLTLVKDGDHRLSRPDDLVRLRAAIDTISEAASGLEQAWLRDCKKAKKALDRRRRTSHRRSSENTFLVNDS